MLVLFLFFGARACRAGLLFFFCRQKSSKKNFCFCVFFWMFDVPSAHFRSSTRTHGPQGKQGEMPPKRPASGKGPAVPAGGDGGGGGGSSKGAGSSKRGARDDDAGVNDAIKKLRDGKDGRGGSVDEVLNGGRRRRRKCARGGADAPGPAPLWISPLPPALRCRRRASHPTATPAQRWRRPRRPCTPPQTQRRVVSVPGVVCGGERKR